MRRFVFFGFTLVLMACASSAESRNDGQGLVGVRRDRLAADERAARYRKTGISPAVSRVEKALLTDLFATPERQRLAKVVAALTAGSADGLERAKRIHDWITFHIAYDSNLLIRMATDEEPDGSTETYGVLKYQRSNCKGLARLYKEMADLAGLECVYVLAYLKAAVSQSGNKLYHAYNAVRVNDRWYIIDCSGDSRVFYRDGKRGAMMAYETRINNLLIHPDAKLLVHYPVDPAQHFGDVRLTLDEWFALPRVDRTFRKYGLSFVDDMRSRISLTRVQARSIELFDTLEAGPAGARFSLRADPDAHLTLRLYDAAGKEYPLHAWAEQDGERWDCLISPPAPGVWTVRLVGQSVADPEMSDSVWNFRVAARAAGKPAGPPVRRLFRARLHGVHITDKDLSGWEGRIMLEASRGPDVSLVSVVRTERGETVQGAVKKIPGTGRDRFLYTIPANGKHTITISSRHPSDPKGYNPAITLGWGE